MDQSIVHFIQWVLICNGIYDILCGFSILYHTCFPFLSFFAKIHLEMYKITIYDDMTHRFFAYWLITYGMFRLFAGVFIDKNISLMASMTYFIEMWVFLNENNFMPMYPFKVLFVVLSSMSIGMFLVYFSNELSYDM